MTYTKGATMSTRRILQVSVTIAVLGLIPAGLAYAAHGGGGGGGHAGGGGGMHSAGGGGGGHYSGGQHYGASPQGNYNHSGGPNVHYGNSNWSQGQHPQNASSWHHPYGGNWGYHDWDHHFYGHYYGGAGWGSWGFWGDPFWFSYWGGYPYGWGGYYADYFCPYGPAYDTASPVAAYGYSYPYADDGQYAANMPPTPAVAAETSQPAAESGAAPSEALQYYNEARAAFGEANYRNALRLAGHAAVESPQNAKVHELISLALFASGDYRGAATEAHAALALARARRLAQFVRLL